RHIGRLAESLTTQRDQDKSVVHSVGHRRFCRCLVLRARIITSREIMGSHTSQNMTALPFLVSSLPGWPDVSVLRAAARAGATAVLNLEAVSEAQARTSLSALALNKPGVLGVRIDDAGSLDMLGDLVKAIDVVVVATGALADTVDLID